MGLAMLLCGIGGLYLAMGDSNMFMAKLKTETYSTFSSYSLSIIPMFLLMGQFATLSGMSSALFKAAESWLGHRRRGCGDGSRGCLCRFWCHLRFLTGHRCHHEQGGAAGIAPLRLLRWFSTATLAAGGTLGILIPPSVILVIYAILTEQNIAKLFLAAFIPGLLAAPRLHADHFHLCTPASGCSRYPRAHALFRTHGGPAESLAGAAGISAGGGRDFIWAGSPPPKGQQSVPPVPVSLPCSPAT
ncbi:MAG: TRAP transporter large permease subunit [Thiolinea sp.]